MARGVKGTRILWEYVVGGYMRYKTETISVAVDKVLGEQLGGLTRLVGPLGARIEAPIVELAPANESAGDDAAFAPDPAKDEAAAGESVKAALDKMFKKKGEVPDGR